MKLKRLRPLAKSLCLGGALVGSAGIVLADDAAMDGLKKENQELKSRMEVLEELAQKQGLLPSGKAPKLVTALSDITISGFVQASYFYNTDKPTDGMSDAYLWNTKDNSFSLNKFKLTIASKPVKTDEWDAGFRASLMFGDDAPALNSPSFDPTGNNRISDSSFANVREAYVELNVPIGTGLNIKAGELISLLNWESGDGGAANPNFSQGYQWWFTGNGPSAGIQGSYNFTEKVGLTLRMDNGLFQGPVDNNEGKALSGSLALKPTKDLWISLIGWFDSQPGDTEVVGGSMIGGYQVTKEFGTGWEFDYFNTDKPGSRSDLWSVGGWAWYDFTPQMGLAFRADYISSPDGPLGPNVRPGAGIGSAGPTDPDGNLGSLTLTLNWKPAPNVKIQPEIRYDYTSFNNGLDGEDNRFIIGCGISYLY